MPNYFTKETPTLKATHADDGSYHSLFNKLTGQFVRWGQNPEDDPVVGPPEILDLEISDGEDCIGCKYCYKANGPGSGDTHNMTLDEFKTIFHKMPRSLTQIAFGIMQVSTNPDFFPMMEYARSKGVVPNYTTNGFGVTEEVATHTARVCGAVAVSCHVKEVAYNAIELFTRAGMTQVNVHQVLYKENLEEVYQLLQDRLTDPRLQKMNAVVLLAYKPKGNNAGKFTPCSVEDYRGIVDFCRIHGISFGFDSCSAPVILKVYEGTPDYSKTAPSIEPCESTLFSSYINCKGEFFACSFCEGEGEWEQGVDVLNCNNFMQDVWDHPKTQAFRKRLLGTTSSCVGCPSQGICRTCPMFSVSNCSSGGEGGV